VQTGKLPMNEVHNAECDEYARRQKYCNEASKLLPLIATLGQHVVGEDQEEESALPGAGRESSSAFSVAGRESSSVLNSVPEAAPAAHASHSCRSDNATDGSQNVPSRVASRKGSRMVPPGLPLQQRMSDRPLLSFFGQPDDGNASSDRHASHAHSQHSSQDDEDEARFNATTANVASDGALDRFLLETVLSTCADATVALTHAVQWGDPHILRTILNSFKHRITPDDLTRPLETALAFASMERTHSRLECVQTLCDADAPAGLIALSALFDPDFTRYALPLRLEEAAKTLKERLVAHKSRCAHAAHPDWTRCASRSRVSSCAHTQTHRAQVHQWHGTDSHAHHQPDEGTHLPRLLRRFALALPYNLYRCCNLSHPAVKRGPPFQRTCWERCRKSSSESHANGRRHQIRQPTQQLP
jgi:hypothetical protein